MKNKEKCYLYIRVSTAMQVDGYSLDAQKDRLVKFAEFQGMEIVREYCDAGKSGKSITGRPEFQRMLQDVADDRDGVSYILVFKLSRFGRNAADVLNSLQYIQDYGVNLICVEDGIDSSKDSGKLTITVLSAVAEIERENILVQTMEGRLTVPAIPEPQTGHFKIPDKICSWSRLWVLFHLTPVTLRLAFAASQVSESMMASWSPSARRYSSCFTRRYWSLVPFTFSVTLLP